MRVMYFDNFDTAAPMPAGLQNVVLPAPTTPDEDRDFRNLEGMKALLRALWQLNRHFPDQYADLAAQAAADVDDEIYSHDSSATVYVADLLADVVTPAPTFTSVSPSHANESTATPVTVHGTGFRPGVAVTIGGEPCTSVVFVSDTQLTCTTPGDLADGTYDLVIANPSGDPCTATGAWTSDPV